MRRLYTKLRTVIFDVLLMNEDNEDPLLVTEIVQWTGAMINSFDGGSRRLLYFGSHFLPKFFGFYEWGFLQGGREPPLLRDLAGIKICLI